MSNIEVSIRLVPPGRGIGPAYEDLVGRRAIRMCDLLSESSLMQRIEALALYHNIFRMNAGNNLINPMDIKAELDEVIPQIVPYIRPVWKDLAEFYDQRKLILYEGAQGFCLDVSHGTYPYVTSSSTLPFQALQTGGLPKVDHILGIAKAYTTRVGSGPLPYRRIRTFRRIFR